MRKLKRSLPNSLALRSKPFPYVCICWERFRRKVDESRMNCAKIRKIYGVTLHPLGFQSSGKKIFYTKSLQAMKSGFFIITLNIENHGLTLSTFDIDAISTSRRFSGGIGKMYCITSCFNWVK